MFSFFSSAQKTLAQLHTLTTLAEQVVLALEQTAQACCCWIPPLRRRSG